MINLHAPNPIQQSRSFVVGTGMFLVYLWSITFVFMSGISSHACLTHLKAWKDVNIPSQCVTELRMGTLSVASGLEKIAALNAEMLAKREGIELVGVKTGGVQSMIRCPINVMKSRPSAVSQLLLRDGCVSIPSVLSHERADDLLEFINAENERAKEEVSCGDIPFDLRFGGVNCRGLDGQFGRRQDMYLPVNNRVVWQSASEAMRNMAPLLREAVTDGAMLHEISSLVADPGALRQCIHADTIVLPCPQYPHVSMKPLYTFFIALQDVSFEMGHTVFLPQTHTPAAHILWNTDQGNKEKFISTCKAVHSELKKGDVAVFDSRLLHCG